MPEEIFIPLTVQPFATQHAHSRDRSQLRQTWSANTKAADGATAVPSFSLWAGTIFCFLTFVDGHRIQKPVFLILLF